MRWVYYFMCWATITESMLHEFDRTWNLFWLLPCLAGIAAMGYCLVQYELHPEERVYLHGFYKDAKVKVDGKHGTS